MREIVVPRDKTVTRCHADPNAADAGDKRFHGGNQGPFRQFLLVGARGSNQRVK